MEIQQLRGFAAVAEHRSFTRAAEVTYRSQPTISLQVKALEDELGTRLIRREPGKPLSLTPEGEALYRLATRLLCEFDCIKDKLSFEASDEASIAERLSIITDLPTVPNLLYEHIREFKQHFPDCELSVTSRNPQMFTEEIASGKVDLGISTQRDLPSDFVHETVYTFNRFLITPWDHPLAGDDEITLEKLTEYPLIVTNCGGAGRKRLDEAFGVAGLEWKMSMELDHPENVKYYVQHGLGVAILNELFIRPENMKDMWIRDVTHWFGQGEVALVYHKNRILTPVARAFASMLLSRDESKQPRAGDVLKTA